MEALRAERFLTAADRETLSKAVASATAGLVHVLTQRNVVSWGPGPGQRSQVVVAPLVIPRTSASNLRAALDKSQLLSLEHLRNHVVPSVNFTLLHWSLDHASGNDRLTREVIRFFEAGPSVAVVALFCTGHGLGNTAKDTPGIRSVVSNMHQLVNLIRRPFLR